MRGGVQSTCGMSKRARLPRQLKEIREFSTTENQENSEQTTVSGFGGYGRIESVDTESQTAKFEWDQADRVIEFRFAESLSEYVRQLNGCYVSVRGVATWDEEERLLDLDVTHIRRERTVWDQLRESQDWKPCKPEPLPHASFDFDVDEFLRVIYEARQGGTCTRPDCDFNVSERLR